MDNVLAQAIYIKQRNQTYYEKNKEKMRQYQKDYYNKYKDIIGPRNLIYCNAYYEKNKGTFKEYYQNNKERRNAYQKAYKNKDEAAMKKYIDLYLSEEKKNNARQKPKLKLVEKKEKKTLLQKEKGSFVISWD